MSIEPAREGLFLSEQHFRQTVYHLLADVKEQTSNIAELLGGISNTMSQQQSDLDAIAAELTTIESDLVSEVQALETAQTSGQPVDLTNLKAIVGKLSSDDAAWKQPVAPGGDTTPAPTTP